MRGTVRCAIFLLGLVVLGGCATTSYNHKQMLCTLAGGLIGGALGAIAHNEEAGVAGGVGGAAAGYFACQEPPEALPGGEVEKTR